MEPRTRRQGGGRGGKDIEAREREGRKEREGENKSPVRKRGGRGKGEKEPSTEKGGRGICGEGNYVIG